MKETRKTAFIEALQKAGGIIYAACDAVGISRATFYAWRASDADFAAAVSDVLEAQVDFVESRLLQKIKDGDTTAMIYYLKTKGKHRGWSEKATPQLPSAPVEVPALPASDDSRREITKRVKRKADYIARLLKKQGKYTAELSMQVKITAQLLVRTEMLAEDVLSDTHAAIDVEYSREGNERKSINPKEKLYLELVSKSQRALRALGMNTDAKERKSDNDSFSDFMQQFKEEP